MKINKKNQKKNKKLIYKIFKVNQIIIKKPKKTMKIIKS